MYLIYSKGSYKSTGLVGREGWERKVKENKEKKNKENKVERRSKHNIVGTWFRRHPLLHIHTELKKKVT